MGSRARQLSLASYFVLALLVWGASLLLLSVHRSPLPRDAIQALSDDTASFDASDNADNSAVWSHTSLLVSRAPGAFKGSDEFDAFVSALSAGLAGSVTVTISLDRVAGLDGCASASGDQASCLASMEAAGASEDDGGLHRSGIYRLLLAPSKNEEAVLILDTGLGAVLQLSQSSVDASKLGTAAAAALKQTWFQALMIGQDALFEIAPSYKFSFFLVGDCRQRVAWDFGNVVLAPFMKRFFDRLHQLFDFELDSQAVQCGDIGGKRFKRPDGGFAVSTEHLQTDFLRATGDWPKDAITEGSFWIPPLINLAVFKPSKPLTLVDSEDQEQDSFAMQGWGIATILPPNDGATSLTQTEAGRVASAWILGLRSWLGLSSGALKDSGSGLAVVAARPVHSGIADWELRLVARALHRQFVRRSARMLADVVSLVDRLPDLVVRAEIGANALEATTLARRALSVAEEGGTPVEALRMAARALRLALETQHDDSVVAEMFFGLDFKAAVYMPLVLPFPALVLAVGREAQAWLAGTRRRREE